MDYPLQDLLRKILTLANANVSRHTFINNLVEELLVFSHCDNVGLFLKEKNLLLGYLSQKQTRGISKRTIDLNTIRYSESISRFAKYDDLLDRLRAQMIDSSYHSFPPFLTKYGSFSTSNISLFLKSQTERNSFQSVLDNLNFKSYALIPLFVDDQKTGLLELQSKQNLFFSANAIANYENLAQALALVLVNQKTQADLSERVKELTCLYGIARINLAADSNLTDVVREIASLLPPAMQYSEFAFAKITVDGTTYETEKIKNSSEAFSIQSAMIVNNKHRGNIEVGYVKEIEPDLCQTFLPEEQNLIDTIARQLSVVIERIELQERLVNPINVKSTNELIHS